MIKVEANDIGIKKGIEILNQNGVIIFPTDTVYGIGTKYTNIGGIKRIRKIKGREKNKPFQILIADMESINFLVKEINCSAKKLMGKYWPGALTIVFEKSTAVSEDISQSKSVGIRFPDDPAILAIIKETGPLVATSANKSGEKSPTKADEVTIEADLIIDGGECKDKIGSTVVDTTKNSVVVLRQGLVDIL